MRLAAVLERLAKSREAQAHYSELADSLLDIAGSCREIARLVDSLTNEERSFEGDLQVDVVSEIGEELVHVIYHALTTREFRPFADRALAMGEVEG